MKLNIFGCKLNGIKIMKIIFLDIDGVICTPKTDFRYLDIRCVNHLNNIVEDTGAKIVISSSWRYGRTLKGLQNLLYNFLLDF